MGTTEGFSLVELVTVIGILGVLCALTVPSVLRWRTNVTIQGDARVFAANLQKAKVLAIKLNSSVVINLYVNGYRIFIDDGSGGATADDWELSGQEPEIGRKIFSGGLTFQHNFSANRLRFSGAGGNKCGTASFIGKNGKQVDVVLSVLGRIRIIEI